jgi:hypothetical protein
MQPSTRKRVWAVVARPLVPADGNRYPTEIQMLPNGMTNPYAPPPSSRFAESHSPIYAVIRKWTALVGSLVATVPVGLAINLVLFDIDFMHGSGGSERTAYYWAASFIFASLLCSSVAARFSSSRLSAFHFWAIYQLGCLLYWAVGIGTINSKIPDRIYFWCPFVVPLLVAAVAPVFNSRSKPKVTSHWD